MFRRTCACRRCDPTRPDHALADSPPTLLVDSLLIPSCNQPPSSQPPLQVATLTLLTRSPCRALPDKTLNPISIWFGLFSADTCPWSTCADLSSGACVRV